MNTINDYFVLNAIENIYQSAKDSELKIDVLQTFENMPFLMDFFSLNEVQTVLYCTIFVNYYEDERNQNSMWNYFNLQKIDSLKF